MVDDAPPAHGPATSAGPSTTAPAAASPGTPVREREANRANWDERVPVHLAAYDVDAFAADPTARTTVARDDLALMTPHLPAVRAARGLPPANLPASDPAHDPASDPQRPLAGMDLLHLQCHLGTDTLSFARAGATVTGVDLSGASITAARDLAARTALPATFVHSDVLTATTALHQLAQQRHQQDPSNLWASATFDVVHTSIGVLPWVADLGAWARVIAAALRPGGLFFIRDAHPVLNAMAWEDPDVAAGKLVLSAPYFPGAPLRYDSGTTYADPDACLGAATTYEWQHSLSEVVQSLLDAGLRLTSLAEHTRLPWRGLPTMVATDDGQAWQLGEHRERAPVAFSLTAVKP